ncbi:D-alanyl-D-alanine carboxypeptidase [Candidatus Saccharibacteria bacterium HGW-Saccharibacteria-1]|jgi:D-alanyl-D-alanine carboxypeptidase|nr:MAG: D-alanyl-D-alanine carboxypeptidase [Candidatus Saccharibacteria bacterium HGW-Saccharibacteria-1]
MKIAQNRSKKTLILPAILLAVSVCFGVIIFINYNPAHSPTVPKSVTTKKSETVKAQESVTAKQSTPEVTKTEPKTITTAFDKSKYSTTDPSSIWIVANKQHQLNPAQFAPSDLVTYGNATISSKAIDDLRAMTQAASSASVTLTAVSSYRSYSTQNTLYNNYVASNGQVAADTFSARPGYSEHQTGLAIDFGSIGNSGCNFDDCFATTAEGSWLAAHAYEYGFLLRYTTDKQSITGYKNEPWHYRYIGRELAAEMKKQSIITLEEFFGVSGGTNY